MPPTIHHLHISQSERITWLCEELGIQYTLKTYTRAPLLSPPELAALTPMKSAPALTDTNPITGAEFTMSETAAIAEYLIHVHGGGRLTLKPGHKNYADYLFWFHWANGSMQPATTRRMTAKLMKPAPDNAFYPWTEESIHKCLATMEARLTETGAWLAGDDFTAADIMNVWGLTTGRMWCHIDLSPYPAVLAYLQRVGQREKYQVAMTKGDPDVDWRKGLTAKGNDLFPPLVELQRSMGIDQDPDQNAVKL